MKKPFNKALEKKEEKMGKDLDRDGEKGESAAHKKKVLGSKPMKETFPNYKIPNVTSPTNKKK